MKVVLSILVALLVAAPASAAVRWGGPQVITRNASPDRRPSVAVNAHGDALVAYVAPAREGHHLDALDVVWRDRHGRAGRRQRLSHGMTQAFGVAVADDGRGFAAWVVEDEEDDLQFHVLVAEAPPGEAFGPPRKVQQIFAGWPDSMHLATEAGRVVLAYNDSGFIQILTWAVGETPGAPVAHDYTPGEPDVAMNDRGEATVSWLGPQDPARSNSRLRAVVSVRVRDGRIGERTVLAPAGVAGYLRTGLGARGSLLASWQATWEEYYYLDRRYGPIHALAVPGNGVRPVVRARRSQREGPQKPELAVARDGTGVVAWQRVRRPEGVTYALRGRVQAARLSARGRRGRPQTLSDPGAIATDARLGTDRAGRTVAVWQQVPPESLSRPLRLVAATAPRGRGFGPPRTVVMPRERVALHTLHAHDRGFLLAYTRRVGKHRTAIVLRSGR